MSEWVEIIEDMEEDSELKILWKNYCDSNTYASGISFEMIMSTILKIAERLKI